MQTMIIRPERGALLFITQPDHAAAAAEVVSRFDGLGNHPRRADIELAVREHDYGWAEIDETLVFDADAGRALDFIQVPEHVKRSVWPHAVDGLAGRSPYAAALVAEHAMFVYSSNRGNPEWQPHFEAFEQRRTTLLEQSGVPLESLTTDYALVAVADLVSLAFCHGWPEARERFGRTVRREPGAVSITPPLVPEPVPITVRARRVPDRRYASAADLRETLDRAPIERLAGIVRGPLS